MKRLKYIVAGMLSLTFLFFTAGCGEKLLDTPTGLTCDETYTLYWQTVSDARSYSLEIKNVENGDTKYEDSHRTYYSLEALEPGDYEVRVQAIGGSLNAMHSEWSEPLALHRDRDSGLAYSYINGNTEYEVAQLGTAKDDVVIEDKYRGKPVTSIAEGAFRGKGNTRIHSVKVGSNVTKIGASAFYNCTELRSVELPDGITFMGEAAFQGCTKLESINIPAALTYLPDHAFNYCRALKQIDLGENIQSIGVSAFADCSALTGIDIPDSVIAIGSYAFSASTVLGDVSIGSGIRYIGDYAFAQCPALTAVSFPEEAEGLVFGNNVFREDVSLSSAILPAGTQEIGTYTFYNCKAFDEVGIPESVKKVGEFSFNNTALYDDQIGSGNGFVYADNWLVAVSVETKMSIEILDESRFAEGKPYGIADNTFITETETGTTGCPELKEVYLPDALRYIGDYAFYSCPRLNKVVTASENSELIEIGNYTFQKCGLLSNVQFFGSKLKRVGNYAFKNCTMLGNNPDPSAYNYLLPASVERVGTQAFNDTSFYTSVASGDGVVYAGRWIVGTNNLTADSITIKEGTIGIADYSFYNCKSLEHVASNGSVLHYGLGAFMDCTKLQHLDRFSMSITEIPDSLFSGCKSLDSISADAGKNIEFPRALTRIGSNAFYGCSSIANVYLQRTRVSDIGDSAFAYCTDVEEITFPEETLTRIGNYVFAGNTLVSSLVFPESLIEIGDGAFSGCTSLAEVQFGENLQTIGDSAFGFCTSLTGLHLPDSVSRLGSYAFYACTALSDITLGRVRSIGDYCFGQSAVVQVRLPATLKHLGDRAFKSCTALTSVLFEYDPSQWDPEDTAPLTVGMHAFLGCDHLTIYTAAPGSVSDDWSNRWNSAFRPVVWGATLSDEGYVFSITVGEENLSNPFARWGFTSPVRDGYQFIGWALTENAAEADFGVNDLADVPPGTLLYAVYVPIENQ